MATKAASTAWNTPYPQPGYSPGQNQKKPRKKRTKSAWPGVGLMGQPQNAGVQPLWDIVRDMERQPNYAAGYAAAGTENPWTRAMSPEIVQANPYTFNQVPTGPALDPLGTPYNVGFRGVTPAGPGYREGQVEPWENWSRSQAGRAAQPDVSGTPAMDARYSALARQEAETEAANERATAALWETPRSRHISSLDTPGGYSAWLQDAQQRRQAAFSGQATTAISPWQGPTVASQDRQQSSLPTEVRKQTAWGIAHPEDMTAAPSTWGNLTPEQQGGIRKREAARAVPYASMAVRQAMVTARAGGRPITRQQAEFDVMTRESGDPWMLGISAGGVPTAQAMALDPRAKAQADASAAWYGAAGAAMAAGQPIGQLGPRPAAGSLWPQKRPPSDMPFSGHEEQMAVYADLYPEPKDFYKAAIDAGIPLDQVHKYGKARWGELWTWVTEPKKARAKKQSQHRQDVREVKARLKKKGLPTGKVVPWERKQ